MRRAIVRGTGHYLPERVVENSWFEDKLDTSDEWIRARTGIERRHFAAEDQRTSDLGILAAQAALADAGLEAAQIDAVIVATSTPDLTFPSVATMVQAGLGMRHGFAYDLQAVCAGFVYALANADALIRAGLADRVLLIGAETFSRIMDWTDRGTCVLFGDGAGAVVLEAAEGQGSSADRGILATDLNSDGQYRDLLYVDGGVASTGTAGHLRMQGNLVFRHAVEKLADTAHRALDRAGLTPDQVDWLVPHQANLRIIEATAKRMHLPMEKVVLTVADHGNTSAASIPLALSVANAEGRFKPGDLLVAEAIGGGLAWGSVVLRW
ncbi:MULTISPECIES: beta-ketoacyl-ACP synthase III [Paracoccus]|jgi:3-oxoacyl-[acyl-carrier-protein] synthase-3|uniref:Beta-ketoacyl-[acyl-carrier-protein] synthase III n=1 Tax=Paracoccus denitrificans (strain Pd 1222) TaxID=318586 RepID=FABH_PARDP|nr:MULTISPECIES: beta-ketoacyl-ACP synthase III [Paracoccus]A1B364.1 RecName: Full=Beta-ketoacyl-[acyl-carrier-protein] synthase III; Short=Beta-ketoacyl-ACP synthase III; Short=KAS III; AltName: Full=3-oxoacyl-[acyl-carrier-protein] synthase 3; AltName: Full=3-oxoacyl-[acyl-carrier-protein] synthase III [Paracoccus denitrificans PD1222]ABL69958.1 3-oxoacyl-[acyl-carrier-protein] synthase III [Paracoccus denitrificans PD1222]MBB4627038.1 3-oxoacyl-[acyl-carrier-protein] synthase-3 [Paracoccus de